MGVFVNVFFLVLLGGIGCWSLEIIPKRRTRYIQQALAEMLLENRTITSLGLRDNDITTVGAQAPF